LGDFPDVASLRQYLGQLIVQAAAQHPPPDYTGVKKSTIQIPVSDGTTIPALLYQPTDAAANGPLVVLYHGGGFCIGIPEMEEPAALECVRNHGAVALSVDYRMAPEHVFPVAITDSFDALKWVTYLFKL
jgi:acetyl esterase/lipase